MDVIEVSQKNTVPETDTPKNMVKSVDHSSAGNGKAKKPVELYSDSKDIDELPLPPNSDVAAAKQALLDKDTDLPSTSDEDGYDLPTPPDGGWGWVVVFSSFMVHIIADGVAYSFGVFYIEFLEHFQGGRGETGWVGSLVVGVTLSSGEITL